MTIKILNKNTSAKIAAGEVIERPFSVVKELIENSLDADAKNISVFLENGGLKSIRVVDDGIGIEKDEIRLAFERFATSKINNDSDFTDVRTLGFRGEALPSIASVSKINLRTRRNSSLNGWRILLNSGEYSELDKIGMPKGTIFEVKDLFYNTPARLKFMDSARSEASKIKSLISSLALINPMISFELYIDGNKRLFSNGNGNLLDIVGMIHGKEVQKNMMLLENDDESQFKFSGVTSNISIYRGNRGYMTFCVNGRLVESQKMKFFVEKSYRTLIPERRFPICVINIQTPLGDVDVNVHPAKTEIRFLREHLVSSLLSNTVIKTIGNHLPNSLERVVDNNNKYKFVSSKDKVNYEIKNDTFANFVNLPLIPQDNNYKNIFRILGQIGRTFLVAEGEGGLFLIDQHAAHERVIYDKILQHYQIGEKVSQPLLEDFVLNIDELSKSNLINHLEDFNNYGWVIEDFGHQSILVRAVPSINGFDIASIDIKDLLINAIDKLSVDRDRKEWHETMFALVACHSSVRAGDKLSNDEIKSIISQLESTEFPQTCPHGRPTMIEYTFDEMKKNFLRL
ncbi:MAG: hypothetical protein CL780_04920 [Chloroflexi bacterium]|nr:hypothetical protein [Chloroflexota bacterium]